VNHLEHTYRRTQRANSVGVEALRRKDILVEFELGKNLLDLAGLRVYVLTYSSLHPQLKDRILKEWKPIL